MIFVWIFWYLCLFSSSQSVTVTIKQRSVTLTKQWPTCPSVWTLTANAEGAVFALVAGTTPRESTVRPASLDTTDLLRWTVLCFTSKDSLFSSEFKYQHVFPSPVQVRAEEEDPCVPCSCDHHGSISQSCVGDSSLATPCKHIALASWLNRLLVKHCCFTVPHRL